MRLVDTGRLDLDVPVRRYITNFRPSEGAEGVTVRQLLNHSAGWLGYDYHDTGKDDGALARYVEDVHRLPQLTPVGRIFSYNNTAISVAGRVIETITGTTFEQSVRELVLDPLGLNRSGYSIDEIGDENVATPHAIVDGRAVATCWSMTSGCGRTSCAAPMIASPGCGWVVACSATSPEPASRRQAEQALPRHQSPGEDKRGGR
jgi:CubicO group peptidase (beta-lactamase class C family)